MCKERGKKKKTFECNVSRNVSVLLTSDMLTRVFKSVFSDSGKLIQLVVSLVKQPISRDMLGIYLIGFSCGLM